MSFTIGTIRSRELVPNMDKFDDSVVSLFREFDTMALLDPLLFSNIISYTEGRMTCCSKGEY